MRSLFILAFVLMQFGAQAVDVPSTVEKTFKTKYPTATDVEWFDDEDGTFSAYFYINEESKMAKFDAKGNWSETKTFIEDSQLPQTVSSAMMANYQGATISSVTKLEMPSVANQYEINAEANGISYSLTYDEKGILLKVLEEASSDGTEDTGEGFSSEEDE